MNTTNPESEQPTGDSVSPVTSASNPSSSSMVTPKGQVTIQPDTAGQIAPQPVAPMTTGSPVEETSMVEPETAPEPSLQDVPVDETAVADTMMNIESVVEVSPKGSSKIGLIVGLLLLLGVLAATYFFFLSE